MFSPRRWLALSAATVLVGAGLTVTGSTAAQAGSLTYDKMNQIQKRILSGLASSELDPASNAITASQVPNYFPRGSGDCTFVNSSNVKVNQNCLNLTDPDLAGRGQAQNETAIAQDPNNPNNMVATFNDYRRGDGSCYAAWSTDKARTWNDSTIPFGFTRGQVQNVADFGASRQYWGGGGDTSVAFDTRGNAYMSCQVFNRGRPASSNADTSSALLMFRSTQNKGASWNFPGRYVRASNDVAGSGLSPFLDKQYMTVDNHTGSPFQDRVYVTWTEFAADGSAYIYDSYSADYGETFSAPKLVSLTSPLCTQTYGAGTPQGNCNENQFSQPFTGPDGALYVLFSNFNNTPKGTDNRSQILLTKSTDGGNTFTPPVKVSDYYDLPDCATYQGGKDPGRACVPEKGSTTNSYFRATNYASGAVNPMKPSQVVVTFGSYINVHSNESNGCVPAGVNPATGNNLYTGVKTPGACNNDILESVSDNGGLTFTGTATDPRTLTSVNQDAGQATTDQWWQWIAFTKNGKLATSYYDRQYGTDEVTGYSDVSLSGSGDLVHFKTQRVTSSSMPPPTQFAGTFFGDYTGLTADLNAYPVWSDTRNPELFVCPGTATTGHPPTVCTASATNADIANDQDIYVAAVGVPAP